MAKRRSLPPKAKRMNRVGRLASARTWLPTYTGKNIIRGYSKHFGVDWRCAVAELKQLGIDFDPAYLAQREKTATQLSQAKRERKQQLKAERDQHWHSFTDPFAAYLAGDFVAMYDLQQREEIADCEQWDETNSFFDCGAIELDNRM